MIQIGEKAQSIINRLEAVDRERPVVDKPRVEQAIAEHFRALGLEPLPVTWANDADDGFKAVIRIARSAARSAAESAARSAAESAARSAAESAARSAARSAAW